MLVVKAPFFLLLLFIPAVLIALTVWLPALRPLVPRRRSELLLRCLALALLIVGLAQPQWNQHAGAGGLGVVIDTSASIVPADRATEATWLRAAAGTASNNSPVTLIRTAGTPSVITLRRPISQSDATALVQPGSDASQTNLAGAITLAGTLLPPGTSTILVSDGAQTTGDASAASIAATNLELDTVALVHRQEDTAITRLSLPASAASGTNPVLQVTLYSTRALTATLSVQVDGHSLGSQAQPVQAGDTPYLINLPPLAPGEHAVHASVSAPGDTVHQNNALDTVIDITQTPRILLITTQPKQSAALTLLRASTVTVDVMTPQAMPSTVAKLLVYDSVVLDDIPAANLTQAQVSALNGAVQQHGIGLLVLGGAHSLTQGHYTQTPLERMLPVLSDTPASLQDGNVALQLVLDRSGSMNDLAGDEPKIAMSRSAAQIAVAFTQQHKDDLGVVSFDYYAHTLFPMQAVTKASAAHATSLINGMTADGGTNIHDALALGITQVLKSNAPYHHILLLTDGRSDPADYAPLLLEAQQNKITVSTLGLGTDADTQLLQAIATSGKGRFYYTDNASDLPRIFAEEARLSAGSAAVNGTIGVQIAANSPTIRSLGAGSLLNLSGYTATVLKPGAVNDLQTNIQNRQPDPLLARWQYGLGRVLVWTPGVENSWSSSWQHTYPNFWADILDWTLRGTHASTYAASIVSGPTSNSIRVDTTANTGAAVNLQRLSLSVHAPGGHTTQVSAEQTAPGLYVAPYQFLTAGIYSVTTQLVTGGVGATTLLAVPYSTEYLPVAADAALLARLSARTHGAVLHTTTQLARLHVRSTGTLELWWALELAALVLFVAALVFGRVAQKEEEWRVDV